ncbi:MAG TPA: FIST C-terminal domain-containing protein [Clostridia bacterium]
MYFETLPKLINHIDSMDLEPTEQLMVLVGEKSSDSISEMSQYLNGRNIKFFGGIYPSLLVGNNSKRSGFILQKHEPVYCSLVFPFMMRMKIEPETLKGCTAIVLIDGLSDQMKELTDTIYDKIGDNVTYVGGGAGFYDLAHRKCIFDNKGMYENALYVCIVKSPSYLAVKHGWKKSEGPFFVKRSRDNILCQLDNYNAFDVYRSVIEDIEGVTLGKEDFFTYAKDYPFGIVQDNGSVIVRDPINLNEDNEIICVASVPEGSDVYILKGDTDTLLASSLEIAELCVNNAPYEYSPMLFDCISRAMFLEDRFEEELSNIQDKMSFPVEGALSIGEIATLKNGEIVIHNKSTVLALLDHEKPGRCRVTTQLTSSTSI